ncbi:hypothetical protein [Streptomyces sp. NPDC001401]|uniref:hypothetical protein n=1 Tax=Streptomyces sp. NPDC001401 TaxID=3364570 RepID=UPI00367DC251
MAGSFDITRVEGHNEVVWTPRGYSVHAELGLVTGGQASLAARARTVVKDALPLLDSLVPLRVDPDVQDAEAFRSLVRHGLEELLLELASPVIRTDRVDVLLDQLTGGTAFVSDPALATADSVAGHLGELREQFGLTGRNVNTIEEERIQTSFHTLADWVLSLDASWRRQKKDIALTGGAGGFLGTTLVRLSQELAVVAAQVDEVFAAMDSVFVTAGERQTIQLRHDSSTTVQSLLEWIAHLTGIEAPKIIQSGGKDALERAVTPVLQRLERMLRDDLVRTFSTSVGLIELCPRGDMIKPPGFHTLRVQLALCELLTYVQQARKTAQRVHRNVEVAISEVRPDILEPLPKQRLTIYGSGLRTDEHTAVIFGRDGNFEREGEIILGKLDMRKIGATDRLVLEFDLRGQAAGPHELAIVRRAAVKGQKFKGEAELLDFTHVYVRPGAPADDRGSAAETQDPAPTAE